VTLVPNVPKTQAHSVPIAPPPMISMLFGTSVSARAPSLSMTPGPSAPGIGSFAGEEPVARMTFFALIVASVPPLTRTFPRSASVAVPLTTSTP
jgi:hypothetical protein